MASNFADFLQPQRDANASTDSLVPVVYDALRRLAQRRMNAERPDHTLQATALVHEAYLRLRKDSSVHWDNAGHFFSAAAEAMRRILVEHARQKGRIKHGGQLSRISIDTAEIAVSDGMDGVLVLDEALRVLEKTDPRKVEVVKLRYFAGFTIAETAELLKLSPATVKTDWTFARAWLEKYIKESAES